MANSNKKTSPKDLAVSKRLAKKITIKESRITYTGAETSQTEPAKVTLTAKDSLEKPTTELKKPKETDPEGKRETHNLLKSLKILTTIMLGKDKNKELAQALDTDKSFTSKQVKELEAAGLVKKETEGREVKYSVDKFNLMKFLQGKVIIKWKGGKEKQ